MRHIAVMARPWLQMVVPESDMSTLDKVDISSFNVTTYRAAYTKQVGQMPDLIFHAALPVQDPSRTLGPWHEVTALTMKVQATMSVQGPAWSS